MTMNSVIKYLRALNAASKQLTYELPQEVAIFLADKCRKEAQTELHCSELEDLLTDFKDDDIGTSSRKKVLSQESNTYLDHIDRIVIHDGFYVDRFYNGPADRAQELEITEIIGLGYASAELGRGGPRRWIYHNLDKTRKILRTASQLYDVPKVTVSEEERIKQLLEELEEETADMYE